MAKVYLESTDTAFTVSNNNTTVFGATGSQVVTVASGVTGVTYDQNTERVVFAGASSAYTYAQAGNSILVYSGGVLVATIPVQGAADTTGNGTGDVAGTQLTFTNGTANAVLTAGVMALGGTTVTGTSTTPAAVTPATIDTTVVSGTVTGGTVTGQSYSLTTSATKDVKALTSGNDTVDGSSVVDSLETGDTIIDSTTTDTDTLNAKITGTPAPTVANVETINIESKYGSGTLDLTNVSGAKNIVATSGISGGSITIDKVSVAAINGTIEASTNIASLIVKGGTTTGTGGSIGVKQGSATSLDLYGKAGYSDTFALTVGSTLSSLLMESTASELSDAGDKVTITPTAASTITLAAQEMAKTVELLGAYDITLKATGAQLTGNTITDSTTAGTTTVKVTATGGTEDLSKIGADIIEVTKVNTAGHELTFKNGANVKLSLTSTTGNDKALDLKSAVVTDSINLTLNGDASLTDDAVYFGTVNMTGAVATTVAADFDQTNVTINASGSNNMTFANTTMAKALNAATLTGVLTATANASLNSIIGGTGSDTIYLADPGAKTLVIDGTSGTDTIMISGAVDLTGAAADNGSIFANIDVIDLSGNTLVTSQKALLANGNTWALKNTGGGGSKAYTITMDSAYGSAIVDLTNVTTSNATFTITGNTSDDSVVGSDGADSITASSGADTLSGGSGNDIFVMATNLTSSDSIVGGSGTGDKIVLSGTYVDSAFTKVSTVETLDMSGASTLTLGTYAQAAGITSITDSGNGATSIDASAYTTGFTVTAGTGIQTITTGSGNDTVTVAAGSIAVATITAGAGNDTITTTSTGNQVTTIKFGATASANGVDTLTGLETGTSATDGEILDFTAFVTGKAMDGGTVDAANTGATTLTEFAAAQTDAINVNNKVALFDNGGTALTATTLIANFAASGKAFLLAAGQKTVVLEATGDGAGTIASGSVNVWYVYDSNVDGVLSVSEATIVGVLGSVDGDAMMGNQIA